MILNIELLDDIHNIKFIVCILIILLQCGTYHALKLVNRLHTVSSNSNWNPFYTALRSVPY